MKVLITEKLSEHRYKTPEGYLVCVDAILARTGPQIYKHNQVYDSSTDEITDVEVDRKPEQVFSPQAIASFENKPLTIQHPNEPVTVANHKSLYHGFARDIRRAVKRNGQILAGSKRPSILQAGDQEVLVGNIIVTTSEAIEEIDNGLEFLSCGYDCDITQTDKPEQINIRGNHIALCDNPRAGITMLQDNVEPAEQPMKHIVKVLTDAVIEQANKVRMNNTLVKGYTFTNPNDAILYTVIMFKQTSTNTFNALLKSKYGKYCITSDLTHTEYGTKFRSSKQFGYDIDEATEQFYHSSAKDSVEDANITKLVKTSKYLANKQSYSEYTSVKIERRSGGYIAITGTKANVEKFIKEHISRGGLIEDTLDSTQYIKIRKGSTFQDIIRTMKLHGFSQRQIEEAERIYDERTLEEVFEYLDSITDVIFMSDSINYVVMCEVLYNGVAVKSRAPWIVFRSEDKSKVELFVRENNSKAKSLVGFSQHYYIK